MVMRRISLWAGCLVTACLLLAGCTGTDASGPPPSLPVISPAILPADTIPTATVSPAAVTGPQVPAATVREIPCSDAILGDMTSIPVLLNGPGWEMAEGCGWTEANLTGSAALLLGNCQARQLIRDGGRVVGIGYDLNLIGSRCRASTHPDIDTTSCSYCLDAGPTITIRYGEMTVQYLAHLDKSEVSRFSTSLPDGAASSTSGTEDRVTFRNGTTYYIFNTSLESGSCAP
jgi:hypothetical protein